MSNFTVYRYIKKRNLQKIFTGVAAAALIFGVWQIFKGPGINLPDTFSAARLEGSLVAQDIVELIEGGNDRLRQISDFDAREQYTDALNAAAKALEENKPIADQATELSRHLEVMLQNLEAVSPPEAQAKAQAAILAEVQLINKLILYSNLQRQLIEELRLKLRAHLNGVKSPGVAIGARVDEINREVRNINALNEDFRRLMGEFDSYFVE